MVLAIGMQSGRQLGVRGQAAYRYFRVVRNRGARRGGLIVTWQQSNSYSG